MTGDERAIRDVIATWMSATKAGDVKTVLDLMADDVVFMTPGREPFGKVEFAAASEVQKAMKLDASSDLRELKVFGDWAFVRNYLKVSATPPNGQPTRREGWTLTILHKEADGKWRLKRDANLMSVKS
jgi:uncharacterized protein (TIGR02246 family)